MNINILSLIYYNIIQSDSDYAIILINHLIKWRLVVFMEYVYDIDVESPFSPGKPVNPENFIGRHNSIEKILQRVGMAKKCNVQHFYLTGSQGIGKTSIALYVEDYIRKKC